MNASAAPPIALIGLMGAGKSEVARELGRRWSAQALDLDAMIEAESGGSIAAWFERLGEVSFREREAELLERAVASGAAVIACGGGIVLGETARATLTRRCRTVWLEVSPPEAARRLAGLEHSRPLLGGTEPESRLAQLLQERAPLYRSAARARVTTDGLSAAEVADAVIAALAGTEHA